MRHARLFMLVGSVALLAFASCTDDDTSPSQDPSNEADASTTSDATVGEDGATSEDGATPDAGTDSGGGTNFDTVSSPNSIRLVPEGWAGLTGTHIVVCGSGCEFRSIATGDPVLETPTSGGSLLAGIPAIGKGNNDQPTYRFDMYSATTSATRAWIDDGWGTTFLRPGGTTSPNYLDAFRVPGTGSVLDVDRQVYGVSYTGDDYTQAGRTPLTRLSGGGVGTTVTREPSAAFAFDSQAVIIVAVPRNEGTAVGTLYLHNLDVDTNVTAVADGTVGEGPHRIRCAGDACLVTNSGSNDATPVTWSGTTASVGSPVKVGTAPVSLDIVEGSPALAVVVNSGSNDLSVVTISGTTATVTKTIALPGCTTPREAVILPGNARVAVACNGSSNVVFADL